jgi:hypothetical protein
MFICSEQYDDNLYMYGMMLIEIVLIHSLLKLLMRTRIAQRIFYLLTLHHVRPLAAGLRLFDFFLPPSFHVRYICLDNH